MYGKIPNTCYNKNVCKFECKDRTTQVDHEGEPVSTLESLFPSITTDEQVTIAGK